MMLRRAIRDIVKTDWSQTRAISSLPCTLAIAIALLAGLAAGKPLAGMVAASGAMSVGFGAFQRLGRSRVMPMLWASIGMMISTAAGGLPAKIPLAPVFFPPAGGVFFLNHN